MGEVSTASPALSTQGMTKHFGAVVALEGLDLEVQRGEIFGFLGPTGSTGPRPLCQSRRFTT